MTDIIMYFSILKNAFSLLAMGGGGVSRKNGYVPMRFGCFVDPDKAVC